MKKITIFLTFALLIVLCSVCRLSAQPWQLNGNADASASSKLGTTNGIPLRLFTSNAERMRIDASGKIGVGTTAPNASALFEVSSSTKGVLFPRMTQAQRDAISFPVNGLLIFQTDGVKGFYYYLNSTWNVLSPSTTGFANTTLSNLSAPTAIGAHLLPSTPNDYDLGAPTLGWRSIYLYGSLFLNGNRFLSAFNNNTYVGAEAGLTNSGSNNTATGFRTLLSNTSGTGNTANGASALIKNTTGENNTATGYSALFQNLTGIYNTANGAFSLRDNTIGNLNTAYGYSTLAQNTTGIGNTATGGHALASNTTGTHNVANGIFTLRVNTTGVSNIAVGNSALFYNTEGSYNTAVGLAALFNNTTNTFNSAFGSEAGSSYNNFSNSTFLGAKTAILGDFSNSTAVGYQATATASNQVVIGNTSVTSIGGYANWSNFSDGRYKKNVREDVPGLEFITKLRPVTYTLNVDGIEAKFNTPTMKTDGTAMSRTEPTAEEKLAKQAKSKIIYTGFVAQEVEETAKKIKYDFSGVDVPQNDKDFYALRYSDFVVPLVKAVQELDVENKNLKEELADLKRIVMDLKKANLDGRSQSNDNLSSLEQNTPNPSGNSTIIRYNVPMNARSAFIVINNSKGQVVKRISLANRGTGQLTLDANSFASGSYNYTLLVEGKQVDTKQMIIAR
jgi:trimeric autotransporter adhesin